ncbi:MAG: hypothetical protein QNJ77_00130 [Acidimicrobiia bacterium]|nr:hypothetical protein [Acidimicrobiia bacterium]
MSNDAGETRESADRGRNRDLLSMGSALILAVVIGLVAFLLTNDGASTSAGDDQLAAPTTTVAEEPATTTTQAATTTRAPEQAIDEVEGDDLASEGVGADLPASTDTIGVRSEGGGDAAFASAPAFAAAQITNMGPTEIGFVTNFPTTNYTWERIELEGPGLSETGWLGVLDGQLVAVSPSWGGGFAGGASQVLVTSISVDGANWEQAGSFELPEQVWVSRIVSDGERIYAVGENPEPFGVGMTHLVFSSSDGVNWTSGELVLDVGEDEHVYLENAAAGPAGLVLAVHFETYPEQQPAILVFDNLEVTLDYMRGTYALTDAGSGEVLVSGTLDELFNWGDEGQRIYDPETGEVLTVVPWQVWEEAWNSFYGGGFGGSPLPIPIEPVEPREPPVVTIDYDGYIITIDEYDGRYTVADAETGDELAAGTLDELYQGPAPQFVDPDTGEVLLAVTWDEWYQAEEQSWQDVEYIEQEYFYRSRTALVTSPDGEVWDIQTVSDGQGGSTSFLAATENGFVAMVNSYGEFGDHGTVWTMADGVWTSAPAERSDLWMYSLASTDEGLIGVGEGSGGPALWSSPDGLSWSSEFAIVPQDDGTHAWLPAVAADETGTVGVLAVKERWSEYRPLEIVQDQYTAVFEDGEAVVTITHTDSGEPVLLLTWEDFDSGAASELVTYEDGATSIVLGNGDVMVITDEEARSARQDLYAGANQIGLSVFLDEGNGWVEAVVDVEGTISHASKLFMADGKVFIGGNYWGDGHHYEGPGEETFVLIVGTPPGG